MSLNQILSTATTGLMAAQQGLRTVSDNISNVNTPGYVRKVVDQTSLVTLGAGDGVDVIGIRRVIDRYLQTASLNASATAGSSAVRAELLDRVQSLFGDPSNDSSFFGRLDQAFSEFGALGNDPSSSLERSDSLSTLQNFFDESSRIASSLSDLQAETDTRVRADVDHVNDLLDKIAKLNGDISRAKYSGTDSSGSENIQAQLVGELSGLIDFQASERPEGGLILRTSDGLLLANNGSAKFAYNTSSGSAGYMTVMPAEGGGTNFEAKLNSGELVGLLQMRDQDIPGAMSQLTEFVSKAAQSINAAHNSFTAVPAPSSLTGKNTGFGSDLDTAAAHFTGKTSLVFLDSAGAIQNRIDIDFDNQQVSVNGGAATAYVAGNTPPTDFQSVINGALSGIGSMTFANGVMTLAANSGGVAIADDATSPSQKAGQGFSQFFGLNDLVRTTSFAPYDTGLAGTDANQFAAGQSISLRISDSTGARLRDVTIAMPSSPTDVNGLLAALNAPGSGVGGYGTFSLDGNGRLTFSSAGTYGASVSVLSDSTAWGTNGPSMSQFFGIGPAERVTAASSFAIAKTINQNPALLALAKVDLTAAAGTPAITPGDGSGGVALATAGERITSFGAVNNFNATSTTVSRYATEFAGLLGRRAASAETQQNSADAVKTEAETRRTSFEGVNMDEELVRLTTYQQAFNASARLIQAANDMYDTLLTMTLQ
ncbi:MAG TPA: flagellar hook-associated protein FlgK [Caulobacteraceae bacterium]|nr:flagellar hook-associated protein FlgK [Caulobacteraceae bacterium]